MNTAVIVGRFQSPYLHPGHLNLIATAIRENKKVVILLGSKTLPDGRNPYSFETRKRMILETFPQVEIRAIWDKDNDKVWSNDLDSMIHQELRPVLYHSRDSFKAQYTGIYPTKEVPEVPGYSATQIRERKLNVSIDNGSTGGVISISSPTTRFQDFVGKHSLRDKDIFFTMNALAGELGELANVVKKEDYAKLWPKYADKCLKEISEGKRETFQDQFVDEAGDVLFFFTQALNKYGVTMDQVMEGQINKLRKQSIEANNVFKK